MTRQGGTDKSITPAYTQIIPFQRTASKKIVGVDTDIECGGVVCSTTGWSKMVVGVRYPLTIRRVENDSQYRIRPNGQGIIGA